jgi:hypothetical protein
MPSKSELLDASEAIRRMISAVERGELDAPSVRHPVFARCALAARPGWVCSTYDTLTADSHRPRRQSLRG